MTPPLEHLLLRGNTLVGAAAPEVIETRNPILWPFSSNSVWNTPVGTGIEVEDLMAPMTRNLRHVRWDPPSEDYPDGRVTKNATGQLNYATYSTAVNRGKPADPPLTIRPVVGGTWGPKSTTPINGVVPEDLVLPHAPENFILAGDMLPSITRVNYLGQSNSGGPISFTNIGTGQNWQPDGFVTVIDEESLTVTEAYKGCWWPTTTTNPDVTPRQPRPASRIIIARAGVINQFSLVGDGWTQPSGRASRMGFLTGLIRSWEMNLAATDAKNAIRHALCMALPLDQLLRPSEDTVENHPAKVVPGYQWPARGRDGHAEDTPGYTGKIRMGTHFVLHPSYDFENDPDLSMEGLALCYALRDFGAYVCDASAYVSLYAEQSVNGQAANRMKIDWQQRILPKMARVLNNTSTNIGGPGPRVRVGAPPIAIPA